MDGAHWGGTVVCLFFTIVIWAYGPACRDRIINEIDGIGLSRVVLGRTV